MPFPKPCNRCGKKFQPNTKFRKLCDECIEKAIKGPRQKKKNVIQYISKRGWTTEKNCP